MTREIKFRAWDKVIRQMFRDGNLLNGDVMVINIDGGLQFSDDDDHKQSDFELMQYTGLKDKNGKEIYEGDIVSWHGPTDPFVIEWSFINAAFAVADKSTGSTHYDYIMDDLHEAEVIGNIYENPELLGEST